MRKLLGLLAFIVASVPVAPAAFASARPQCDDFFVMFIHPDSGDEQCMWLWVCDDGSYGGSYTAHELC